MAFWDKAFGRGNFKTPAPANLVPTEVELDGLIRAFGQATEFWATQQERGVLARARLADACRDAQVRPVSEIEFLACWKALDDEAQQRFSLLTSALEMPAVLGRLAEICLAATGRPALDRMQDLAARLKYLTIAVLQESDIRLEEFARHFCSVWHLVIQGESPEHAATRLHQIDFGRLMQEAETARSSAEDRLAYLRKLQEEQEATRRPRRGKW